MSVPRTTQGPYPLALSSEPEVRRERILAAALEVMSRKGFHRTSIAEISARARVSRAAVYRYFRTKRHVLAAIADSVADCTIGAVDGWAPMPSGPSTEEPRELISRLRLMLDTRASQVLTAILVDADAARLVFRPDRGIDELTDDAMRRIDAHLVRVIGQDVQTAIDRGWARPCDAPTIARYLLGGIEKLLIDALDPERPVPLDKPAVAREIGALVFFGLARSHLIALALDPDQPAPDRGRAGHPTHGEEKQD